MKIINTNKLLEAIDNVGEFEPRIHPEVPASFAAAVEDARKMEKHADEVLKEKEKESKDSGLGNTEKDREGYKIKYNPGAKKMHLEESLFEEITPKIVTIQEWGYNPEDDVYEDDYKDKVLEYRRMRGKA